MKNYIEVFGTLIDKKLLRLMISEAVVLVGRSELVLKEELLVLPLVPTCAWSGRNITEMCYVYSGGADSKSMSEWEEKKTAWLRRLAAASGFVGDISDWTLGELVDATFCLSKARHVRSLVFFDLT